MPRLSLSALTTALVLGLSAQSTAWAQMVQKDKRVEPPAPPPMQSFDDPSLEPQVTIRQTATGTESEYRIRGRLYMVKVVPTLGAPYFLIDQKGDGKFVRADDVGPTVQPPMWVISTF